MLTAAIVGVLLLLGVPSPSAAAAMPPAGPDGGFLTQRSPVNQTVGDLAKGGLVEQLRCAEDCVVSGRLLIARADAYRLGLTKSRRGKWFELGRLENAVLRGGGWHYVKLPVRRAIARVLAGGGRSIRVRGEHLAISTGSARFGAGAWSAACAAT